MRLVRAVREVDDRKEGPNGGDGSREKRTGLPDIRFHDLRHTCATLLLSRGHHPKLVQELLGHSSVAMTLDRYSHVMPGISDRTATAMEAALS